MRRCTGLRPSRTSGSARPVTTDIAYVRNRSRTSSAMFTVSIVSAMSVPRPYSGDFRAATTRGYSSEPIN